MSGQQGLDPLAERLHAMAGEPVHTHPDALETVHRALVDELDALAGAGSVSGERRAR